MYHCSYNVFVCFYIYVLMLVYVFISRVVTRLVEILKCQWPSTERCANYKDVSFTKHVVGFRLFFTFRNKRIVFPMLFVSFTYDPVLRGVSSHSFSELFVSGLLQYIIHTARYNNSDIAQTLIKFHYWAQKLTRFKTLRAMMPSRTKMSTKWRFPAGAHAQSKWFSEWLSVD